MQSNITLRILSILFYVEQNVEEMEIQKANNKMTLLAIKTFKLKPLY